MHVSCFAIIKVSCILPSSRPLISIESIFCHANYLETANVRISLHLETLCFCISAHAAIFMIK